MIHGLFVETQARGGLREGPHGAQQLAREDAVFADETALSATLISFPQDRNLHGKVFGGFLMRQAFEIAFAAGATKIGIPKRVSIRIVFVLLLARGGSSSTNRRYDFSVAPAGLSEPTRILRDSPGFTANIAGKKTISVVAEISNDVGVVVARVVVARVLAARHLAHDPRPRAALLRVDGRARDLCAGR